MSFLNTTKNIPIKVIIFRLLLSNFTNKGNNRYIEKSGFKNQRCGVNPLSSKLSVSLSFM